jgi:hypothetical protein
MFVKVVKAANINKNRSNYKINILHNKKYVFFNKNEKKTYLK